MKNRVEIVKGNDQLHFYYLSEQYGKQYLFTRPFSKGEYIYFKNGLSENELRSFHNWNKNPRLDKTIRRVIKMCRYIEKDLEASMDYMPVEFLQNSKTSSYNKSASEYCR